VQYRFTTRGFPETFGEFTRTDIFQKVGERPRAQRRENVLIFCVGSQDDDLGSRADLLYLAYGFHAVHARQEQYNVWYQFLNKGKHNLSALGFPNKLQVGMHVKQGLYALPNDSVIVIDENGYVLAHVVTLCSDDVSPVVYSRRQSTAMRVPAPMALWISMVPPACSMRSRIERKPKPVCSCAFTSNPCP